MDQTQQRMREIIATKKQKQPMLASETHAKAAPKPEPEMIKHRCGHLVGVNQYRGQDCPTCRHNARAEKARRNREKLAPKTPKPLLDDKGRLPHGAEFHSVYDADTQTWNVLMFVNGQSFHATGSSVERTMRELAGKWREGKQS